MSNRLRLSVAATALALGVASFASAASALPRGDALAAKNLGTRNVETVQYRAARWRGGWRGPGWRGRGWYGYRRGWYGPGWGWGAGFVGGAVVGTALAAPYYYGYGPGYYAPPPGPAHMCWVSTDDRGYGYWAACR